MLSNLKNIEENKEYLKSIIGIVRRNQIDWKNGIGKEIEYKYDWEGECSTGVLKIVEYEPKTNKVYFEGYEKGIGTGHLTKCELSGILNIILYKAPWMIDLGVSEEDAKVYTVGSGKKIEVKCPNCGRVKKIKPNTIYHRRSISCSCGDGISYPEKLMESVLIQLGIKYKWQYKTSWSQNKMYDFYLPDYNIIIETHGEQHYEESARGRSLKEEQENDKLKEELAFKNGIEHYIVINCSVSDLEYIKNNILDCELNELFNLSNINWNKCEEYALKNLVKEICDYYKEYPMISTSDLAKEFNINRSTIIKHLKQGAKLGWCEYDAKEEMRHSGKLRGGYNSKQVSQFTLENKLIKTYSSTHEAWRQTGINYSNISECCNGRRKTAGGYYWEYADK